MAEPLFAAGEWVTTAESAPVILPFDGSEIGSTHVADAALVDRAIAGAVKAAPALREWSNGERSALLFRAHAALLAAQPEFARLVALETGKPIREARMEAARAAETLLESAVVARELRGEVVAMDAAEGGKGRMAMTVREPLGVIGAITPWNFPLNLAMHKVGPALAAGNAVVHKPSEMTPLTALRLARLFEEAGVPKGAYSVLVGGPDVGQQIVQDARVAMITFTGSVEAGKWIRAHAGLKKVTLELGGNSPVIVEADGDVELAAARCAMGAYVNNGQSCVSVQRIFVHEDVAARFAEHMAAAAEKLRVAHPLEENAEVTSLIREKEAVRVRAWLEEAGSRGASLLTGGERRGATLTPALVDGLPAGTRLSCEEVFGPVAAMVRYRNLEEAVAGANGTAFGLQAGIFTRDLSRAFRAARAIAAGGVMINEVPTFRVDHMPYGGAKESGLGREGPRYAAEEMTESKLICWR